MKRFTHLLTILLVVTLVDFEFASAYEPAVQWQKTLGTSRFDVGYSIRQTSDGGYIIAGKTYFFTEPYREQYSYVYLIKTNSSGNSLWEKTSGGRGWHAGYSVQQTTDGGYIVAGYASSIGLGGGGDVYLIKTNPNGNFQWQKTFGGYNLDLAHSVQQTIDEGYVIAGTTDSFGAMNVYLIKTDPNGNKNWQKSFGTGLDDRGNSVQQTSDGGYIIAGFTYSFGAGNEPNVYLIKADPKGNLLWQKTFGGSNHDWGSLVQQTFDGGYIIVGGTNSFGEGLEDVYFIKTDPNGNLLWQKTFGGSNLDCGYSVQQTSDRGYIITGGTDSFGAGGSDVYLIKTDPNGNLLWQKTFGGKDADTGYSVQQTSDGGYIIAGTTESFGAGNSDVYLIKLSAEVCQYALFGDFNNDCKVDFYDFALMAANWLVDCYQIPDDPACVPK